VKKNLLVASLAIALTALVTFLIGPKGGLPEPLGSDVGQFLSRTFYTSFLALGIGYSIFSPLDENEPRWKRIVFVVGVVVSCLVVEQVLDHFIWEPRPGWKNIVGKSSGFPSGHSIGAFAMASLLATLRPKIAPIFFFCAFLVGYSRVEVGAHYPHQVVAGAIIGVMIAFWLMGFREKLAKKSPNSLAQSQSS